jgi:hypothetical protein
MNVDVAEIFSFSLRASGTKIQNHAAKNHIPKVWVFKVPIECLRCKLQKVCISSAQDGHNSKRVRLLGGFFASKVDSAESVCAHHQIKHLADFSLPFRQNGSGSFRQMPTGRYSRRSEDTVGTIIISV